MAWNSAENAQLFVDRNELARLCGKSPVTVKAWMRRGVIERANPDAAPGECALFDLAICLPRILSYVGDARELTPEEKAFAAAKLRVMEARAAQAELAYKEAAGELFSMSEVLGVVGPQHVAFRQRMLGLPSKTARALSTMTDSVEIQKVLTLEVRQALTELVGFRQ